MNKQGQGAEPAATATDARPNTGQGAQESPAAVGAGPGNQLQDNLTGPEDQGNVPTELKPGALPDGTAPEGTRGPRNEDIEQASGSRYDGGIE